MGNFLAEDLWARFALLAGLKRLESTRQNRDLAESRCEEWEVSGDTWMSTWVEYWPVAGTWLLLSLKTVIIIITVIQVLIQHFLSSGCFWGTLSGNASEKVWLCGSLPQGAGLDLGNWTQRSWMELLGGWDKMAWLHQASALGPVVGRNVVWKLYTSDLQDSKGCLRGHQEYAPTPPHPHVHTLGGSGTAHIFPQLDAETPGSPSICVTPGSWVASQFCRACVHLNTLEEEAQWTVAMVRCDCWIAGWYLSRLLH